MAFKVVLEYIPGPLKWLQKRWKLSEPLTVQLSGGELLTIPKGFKTDLSSVPRILWPIFPPYGDFIPAAIVHDWMYIYDYKREELGTKGARKFADNEFYFLSRVHNPKAPIDNYLRFLAVRLFGASIYKK